jgi:hypothetical protein
MPGFGRQVLSSTGRDVQVSADGSPRWAAGGITIDWATVTAEVSDRTLVDGTIVKAGAKGIEFGTVLAELAIAEAQTITISATGGTFTITGNSATTAAIAYNATAATVQTAVRGLGGAYAQVAVTGSAGGPYTFTYPYGSGDVAALTTTATSLTGGSGTAVVATSTAGVSSGTYGPASSTATDGRQALVRGRCFILNRSVREYDALGLATKATDHPGVFDGGRVWRARLNIGGDNPTSIGGLEPTLAAFETAFPGITYVDL